MIVSWWSAISNYKKSSWTQLELASERCSVIPVSMGWRSGVWGPSWGNLTIVKAILLQRASDQVREPRRHPGPDSASLRELLWGRTCIILNKFTNSLLKLQFYDVILTHISPSIVNYMQLRPMMERPRRKTSVTSRGGARGGLSQKCWILFETQASATRKSNLGSHCLYDAAMLWNPDWRLVVPELSHSLTVRCGDSTRSC